MSHSHFGGVPPDSHTVNLGGQRPLWYPKIHDRFTNSR